MDILKKDLNNINFDDTHYDEDNPDTIIVIVRLFILLLSDFWLDILNFENAKNLKKKISERLIPIAWHPRRWWNFCTLQDEKKEKKK